MLMKFYKEKGRRLLSLLLTLAMLLSNFTGIAYATENDLDEGTVCGVAAHVHDGTCVELVAQLICDLEEDDTHAHTAECYQEQLVTICEQQEHTHEDSCYIMLLADDTEDDGDSSSSGSSDISGYTVGVTVYNYLYRSGAMGQNDIMSQDGAFTLSGSLNNTITIGGVAAEEDGSRKPKANDIIMNLAGLKVNDAVIVNAVFPEQPAGYKTVLNVTAASVFASLTLGIDAVAVLNVNADMSISALSLSEGSVLTVNVADGCTLTLTETAGSGNLGISGGSVVGSSLSAGTLTINGTNVTMTTVCAAGSLTLTDVQITAEQGTITAGSISAVNTTVNGASLFGFDAAVTGTADIRFTNCRFNQVARVGAADDCTALVRFAEDCSVTAEASSYVRDYTISYVTADGTVGENWIHSYRVSSETLAGAGNVVATDTILPTYTTPGYTYQGWKTAPDAENYITDLTGQQGDLTLYPHTEAETITVTMDLMFDLNAENCDDAETWKQKYQTNAESKTSVKQLAAELDSKLTLDTPNRFGYTFAGWQLSGTQTVITDTEHQILYDQLTDKENYVLRLEAVWVRDTFPLYWQFDGIELKYIELSVDGGQTWATPKAFAEANSNLWTWEESSESVRTTKAGEIMFGESLEDYFTRLNASWQCPILRDTRALSNDSAEVEAAQAFQKWYWNSQKLSVYASNTFDAADSTGILQYAKGESMTWSEYQVNYLKLQFPVILASVFGTADYHLYIGESGWTYQINGAQQEPENGVITVPNGATVTLSSTLASGLVISNWEFRSQSTITVKERYPGGDTVYYDFTMPACDVTASYQKTIDGQYVDIAQSDITFEEGVDPTGSGITRDGFWYRERLVSGQSANCGLPLMGITPLAYDAAKGYFYIWDTSKELFVTSDGIPTQNQLTLVKTVKVRFNAVNLTDREAYTEHAVGRTIFGYSVEIPRDSSAAGAGQSKVADAVNSRGNLGDLGNIVIKDDASVVQTFTLTFEGTENYVASIFNDRYYYGANNDLVIQGSGTASLTLGTAFASCVFSVINITVNTTDTKCDYFIHAVSESGKVTFSNATVNAPQKEVYVKNSSFVMSSNAVADIGVLVAGTSMSVGEKCRLRVRGDVYCGYQSLSVGKNSVVVIDGSFLINYYHWSLNINRGATGAYVIVKGNRCELGNVHWTAGTLICNTLVFGRTGGVAGGTVIANQITNPPMKNWDIAAGETEYKFTDLGYISSVTANGDTFPFVTYSQSSSTIDAFTFNGGKTYLLGHSSSGNYDPTIVVETTPVQNIVEKLLDTDGNYNDTAVDEADVLSEVETSPYNSNECIILGNSTYITGSRNRSIKFSGNAELYAAGNVTLFNDTTVSENAVIWCGGTFGSKNDLTITGGTVTAKEVGIAYDLTTVLEDNTVRWKKLSISGGSVNADRIGTLSSCVSDTSKTVYGAASIDINCINPSTDESVALEFDEYVNYLLGTVGFANPEANKQLTSVHISGSVQSGSGTAVYSAAPTTFAAPVCDGIAGGWKLGTTSGESVDGIGADANMTYEGKSLTAAAYDDDRLVLLAVKESYNITVMAGSEYVEDLHGSGKVSQTTGKAGTTITLRLSDSNYAADKTVVWYTDANGYVCNPGYEVSGDTVTFTMPYNDVEVYIAPESLTLDLSKYHVTILKDGFRTRLDEVADGQFDEREFHYTGSLIITQSLTAETDYRIRVLEDVDNLDTSRDFTLKTIHQKETYSDIGLLLENGAKARFLISDSVELCRVEVPELSEILLKGADAERTNNPLTIQCAPSFSAVGNDVAIGKYNGKAGCITLENLQIQSISNKLPGFGVSDIKNSNSKISYINCVLTANDWYSASSLAENIGRVEILKCDFEITVSTSWPAGLFSSCDNVDIKESNLSFLDVGSRSSKASVLSCGIKDTLRISDSTINTTLRNSASSTYMTNVNSSDNAPKVILDGNTVYNAEERMIFRTLILKGNSVLNMGANKDGYLFGYDIQMSENAQINADTVLISGFLTSELSNKDEVLANLSGTKPTVRDGSGGGLFISGGTVNASAVGGDCNSVIEVSGGSLNADRIGTLGALYGYAAYVPATNEDWVYTYTKVPTGATISITGGTVNVGEYLGGMNSAVNIAGGTVNLRSGAILGITNDQAQTLKTYYATLGKDVAEQENITVAISSGEVLGDEGTINTPYGETIITGTNTGVKVGNISALYGDVTIRESANSYTNGLLGQESVGVYVSKTLTAQNITISDNAKVYADTALANAPEVDDQATLSVLDSSVLYTKTYGSSGQGSVTIIGEENVNIIKEQRQYAITYILHDDDIDVARNSSANPDTFVFDAEGKTSVQLESAERDGYEFVRWYTYADDGTTLTVSSFYCNANYDVVLHAEWKPKEVVFQICVDTNETFVGSETELKSLGNTIEIDGNIVTFEKTVSIPYREDIFGTGENGIILDNFSFPSYTILKLQVAEEDLTYELEPASATVTRELLEAYEKKGTPIVLKAVKVTKKNEMLTMDLNLVDGRPADAAFQENSADSNGNTIFARVAVGDTIAAAEGLVIDGKLNQPTAPGYSFNGWNTKPDGTGLTIGVDYEVGGNATTFYAQWTPYQYTVAFDSSGGYVTMEGTEPDKNTPGVLSAYVFYDTVINGGISYTYGEDGTNELPIAWKPGYHFQGWSVDGGKTLLTKEELNEATFGDMDVGVSSEDKVAILTLTAVYTPVSVTYHTDEGIFTEEWLQNTGTVELLDAQGNTVGWKSEAKDGAVGYGIPLAGYTLNPQEGDGYILSDNKPSEDSNTYAVLSTTAVYYNNKSTYHEGDYRFAIGKKGYTFLGWNTKADGTGKYVGTLPAYEDIELYAQWSANTYTLVLNRGTSEYSDLLGDDPTDADTRVSVTVGKLIDGTTSEDIETKWSDRTGWYAKAKAELVSAKDDTRYILGFTFDPLEPGAPSSVTGDTTSDHSVAYLWYAANVTNLINNDALLTKVELLGDVKTEGSIFHLPADDEYNSNKVTGTNAVPDYPDGYTIDMYAVYRERSLVFIQRYVDTDNQVQETVMYTAPYSAYSDYPDIYKETDAYKEVAAKGYSLVKWSVNDIQTGDNYVDNKAVYESKLSEWQTAANAKGSYDINIYTVYAASVEDAITLTATKVPSSATAQDYLLPGSMVVDEMSYTIEWPDDPQLKIVSWEELKGKRYDVDSVKCVAIEMELLDPNGDLKETLWLNSDGGNTSIAIGKGWTIRMNLYHSRVISQEKEMSFKIKMTFKDETAQQITLNTTVKLVPTEWTVNYEVNLPTGDAHLQVQNNGFSGTGNVRTATDYNWVYGTALKNVLPDVEGYKGVGYWTYSETQTYTYGADGTMTLTGPDAIKLTTSYEIQSYQLKNSAEGKCKISATGTVSYHTPVTITPGETNPAFIWLQYDGQNYRLDQLTTDEYPFFVAEQNGVYTVLMPAGNVEVFYDDVMELYLDEGTIDIDKDGYIQHKAAGTVKETWQGHYVIWQDRNDNADFHETANVLNLSDDLAGRTIELGNLNITSEDSIALATGCTAELTAAGSIKGKNILVPEGAYLTMCGKDGGDQAVTLAPGTDRAAIGGMAAGGSIVLQNLNLTLNMPAGSNASGIGAGNSETDSVAVINVVSCDITVTEGNVVGLNSYNGTWIGGKKTGSVNLNGTTLSNSGSESNVAMVNADSVKILGCTIGTESARIINHTLRGGNIEIDDSEIYLTGNAQTLLCPENTLSVDKNWIETGNETVININGAPTETLYTGKLQICHPSTDVVIWSNRLLELRNGHITVTEQGSTQTYENQTAYSHAHTGAYRLLSAFDTYQGTSDVTVESLQPNMYITAEEACRITKLAIWGDSDLRPLGLLQVSSVEIAEGKLLTVNAGDETGVKVTDAFGGNGSYTQNGGKLASNTDVIVAGNMTLNGVTADVSNRKIGSSGTVGVSTVTIAGGSITAESIGAVGTQSKGFTFVVLKDSPTLHGTLVQDHYRLHYNLSDANFKLDDDVPYATETEKLPTVLRSKTIYQNGEKGKTDYLPEIPDDPCYQGEGNSYFSSWYFVSGTEKIALRTEDVVGLSSKGTLSADTLSYAADTDPEDGTQTLEIYPWMNLNGEGIIAYGRELNNLTNGEKTTEIETNGAWTARFTVSGVVLKDACYRFTFDNEIPAGTKLTLRFGENDPVYYYCITTENTKIVDESNFFRMGTESEHAKLMTEEGSAMEHVLQLSADFADVSAAANSVALSVESGSGTHPIADVSYTVKAAATASCAADGSSVSYSVIPNGDTRLSGKTLYLVAQLRKEGERISVPYGAKFSLNSNVGTWIGGDAAYFALGSFAEMQSADTWSVSGLEGGNYTVTWYLTAADKDTQNVFEYVLAKSEPVSFTLEAKVQPSLDVVLESVDGNAVKGYVLAAGNTHSIRFTYDMADVQVMLEKQGALQNFEAVGNAEANGTIVTVPAEAGVYRIRFSLDGFGDSSSDWDDAYFTFIVK